MKKAHWLVFACLLLFSATACVDNAYEDLGDVETDATVGGDAFAIPLGSTKPFMLEQFLPEDIVNKGLTDQITSWDLPEDWTLGMLTTSQSSVTASSISLAKQLPSDLPDGFEIPDLSSLSPAFIADLKEELKTYDNTNPENVPLNKLKESVKGKELFGNLVDTILVKDTTLNFEETYSDTIKDLGKSLEDFSKNVSGMVLEGVIVVNNPLAPDLVLETKVVGLDTAKKPMGTPEDGNAAGRTPFKITVLGSTGNTTKKQVFDAIAITAKIKISAKAVRTLDKEKLDQLSIRIENLSIGITGGGIKLGGD